MEHNRSSETVLSPRQVIDTPTMSSEMKEEAVVTPNAEEELNQHVSRQNCSFDGSAQEEFVLSESNKDNDTFSSTADIDVDNNIGKIGDDHALGQLSPIPLTGEEKSRPALTVADTDILGDKNDETKEPACTLRSEFDQESSQECSAIKDDKGNKDLIKDNMNEEEETESRQEDLNESVTSTGSLREEEILKTKEELGATSMAFIQRLRGAAFRRKMDLTRSRDSLAAKEREQRKAIAASKAARSQRRQSEPLPRQSSKPKLVNKHFQARPLPVTTGSKGTGGMSGVPKVQKKPTTTPFSPLLGARRQTLDAGGQTQTRPTPKPNDPTAFHARPLPPTTGRSGHAGQAGVPKVPKRPTTVPFSPLLGPRRRKEVNSGKVDGQTPAGRKQNSNDSSQRSSSGLALVGLSFLGSSNENRPPVTPKNLPVGYQPHSTARAKKRADFEAQRAQNEQRRREVESGERRQKIKALQKDLGKLRESL